MTVYAENIPLEQTATGKATSPISTLLPHHYQELRASGIPDEFLTRPGAPYSEQSCRAVAELLNQSSVNQKHVPALVFPYLDHNGQRVFSRVKPAYPRKDRNGRLAKYLQPSGVSPRAYLPFGNGVASGDRTAIYLVEGEKKAIAMLAAGFPAVGLAGVRCWCVPRTSRLLLDLERIEWDGRPVYVVFDSDRSENPEVEDAARMFAAALKRKGAAVKLVTIPPGPPGEDGKPTKQGADDFLVRQGAEEFRKLVSAAEEPEPPDAGSFQVDAKEADPAREAVSILALMTVDGVPTLRFWRGGFTRWVSGAYRDVQPSEVRGAVIRHLNRRFTKVHAGLVGDVIDQLKAQSHIAAHLDPPCWLGDTPGPWPADGVLVTKTGMVHLPSLVAGQECTAPLTPRLFTTSAVDYAFDPQAPRPTRWLDFLAELWGDDSESIETLQEWLGYLLTPDTAQQKIFLLIGPKRSGKGTIARVLRALVGPANVVAPTLASFGGNFGLWPLLGKSLAIISDARLGGRADQAVIVEVLLRTSGEDAVTIERKYQEGITLKLPTRFLILSNELPRLSDPSGATAGRMICLRLTRSFYRKEDPALTAKLLDELPGILLWSIAGWDRLRQRGYFTEPGSSKAMAEVLGDLGSPVGAFLRECCLLTSGVFATVEELYARWGDWTKEQGWKDPGTQQSFGRQLLAAAPTVQPVRRGPRGEQRRNYQGVRLLVFGEKTSGEGGP